MEEKVEEKPHVAVLGLGYVGCVSAACLAQIGNRVTGIEYVPHKVDTINSGNSPFFEPGLGALIKSNVAAGRLRATTDLRAIDEADIALVCVGTPSAVNGNQGLDQLSRLVEEIASNTQGRSKRLVVAIRSTVLPGTCEELVIPVLASNPMIRVVSNPEFLREGTAICDFMKPSLIVVGGEESEPVDRVASLYGTLPKAVSRVRLRTAEMIKYACNAFHAVKISFANEIGSLSARLGLDPAEVMSTVCADTSLNISPTYLRPGFAFGGSCLPKDLRALTYRANQMDLRVPLLESALPSNREHLARAVDSVLEIPHCRLGLIGLAFKESTDDLRESPVVAMLETLIGKGRNVRIFDPQIRLDAIYGSNKSFLLWQIPHIGRLLDSTIDKTLAWAEQLVVAQNLSPEIAERVRLSGLPVTNLVDPSLTYLKSSADSFAMA